MKRLIIGILAGAGLGLGYAPSAQAASFLQINVGGTIVTCDNSQAIVNGTNCGTTTGGAFTTVANANTIQFSGTVNGVSFGNSSAVGVQLVGNQPGSPLGANTTDSKAVLINNSGVTKSVTVSFASNDFSLPAGSPLALQATQTLQGSQFGTSATQGFKGWGDAGNSLTPGAGAVSDAGSCAVANVNSCSANGPIVLFARSGNFALSGIEVLSIANSSQINAQGSVSATPTGVPEPASMVLLGSGLVALGYRARRRLRNRK